MLKANPYVAPIYFIVFALCFYLILLNMFIAIIGVYYEETMREIGEEEKGKVLPSTQQVIENELKRAFNEIVEGLDEERKKAKSKEEKEQFRLLAVSKLPFTYRMFAKLLGTEFVLPKKTKVVHKVEELPFEEEKVEESKQDSEQSKDENDEVSVPPLIQDFLAQTAKYKGAYQEDKNFPELEQGKATLWLATLESTVANNPSYKGLFHSLIKCPPTSEVSIEFYPKSQIDNLTASVKDFLFTPKRSKAQKEIWAKADLSTKYSYWCGMDAVYSEYYHSEAIYERVSSPKESLSDIDPPESVVMSHQLEESKEGLHIIGNKLLGPAIGNVTLKEMFNSAEYKSNYATIGPLIQWQYWKEMSVEDKIGLWIFHFTGKQRVRLWKRMEFSKEGVAAYIGRNGLAVDPSQKFEDVWKAIQNLKKNDTEEEIKESEPDVPVEDMARKVECFNETCYKHRVGLLNCILCKRFNGQICYLTKHRTSWRRSARNYSEGSAYCKD
eukprot:TRINITY_DN238_c0_g2_i1.p2 TRINITY_DN238_c0_g2~~TRINITY_DN238_c0_g2_i1.p2  ORF type:complete len:497 (+),score=81.76 TRINITY_DN238_c0_g2_i1:3949-5439(+)